MTGKESFLSAFKSVKGPMFPPCSSVLQQFIRDKMVWKGKLCNTSSSSSPALLLQVLSLYKAGNGTNTSVLCFW